MALENLLKVGDGLYDFKFPEGQGGGTPGFISNGVIDTKMKLKRLRETVIKRHLFKKDEVEVTVIYDEVAFRWLPWVNGKINYAQSEGKDVLSGMFTGCWMTTYKEAGTQRVAHVATQTDAGDCKHAWRSHRGLAGITQIQEFLPSRGMKGTFNLGLITATGGLYKFELSADNTITITNPWTTAEEWMAPDKGNAKKDVAEWMAKQAEVPAVSVFGGASYRIKKIEGPLSTEAFPA